MAIDINIGSKLDSKGFKQAETAVDKLNKNAKNLARTFGITFGASAVLAYAKKSVKAAAADQAAQASLAQTLKNLGYENAATATSVNDFISSLERQTGILDDELRPAMDRLLRATGSVTESQKLMSLALDVSAGTGKSLSQVSQSLQKAYLGQTQALGRLGVGLSKAELTSSNFEQITARLGVLFAGQAKRQAESFEGSINKLSVAANNASETIGTGLIDALKLLGEDTSVDDLASNMQDTATYVADVIRGIGVLTAKLKNIPVVGSFNVGMIPIVGSYIEILRKAGIQTKELTAADNAHLQSLLATFNVIKKTTSTAKKLTAEDLKQLKAKQLSAAIDKANLALGKGTDVFDMEKIQLEAARINQVDQLKKVTNQAQLLAITNDLARLQVLRDIKNLEDAIATGDIIKIQAATDKLNADLKVLGALTNQQIKLVEIKDILNGLVPKSLIDIDNLTKAIGLLNGLAVPKGGTIDIKITDATAAALTAAITAAAAAGAAATSAAAVAAQISKDAAGTLVKVSDITSTFGAKDILTSIVTATSIAAAVSGRIGTGVSGASDPRVMYGGQRLDSAGNAIGYNAEQAYAMSAEGRAATMAAIEAANKAGLTVNNNFNGIVGDSNALATLIAKIVQDALDRGTIKASPLP
jgi:hypothetical protein